MAQASAKERLAPMLDGCFVVAPDLVGHGRSDHRRHDSGYYLWEHAEDMLAVTDSLGLAQFHVLAHGMGTGVASLLAAMTSGIASMTFLDGMGAPFTVAEDDRVQHLARAYRLKRMVQRSQLPGFAEPDPGRFDDLDTALAQRRERLDTARGHSPAKPLPGARPPCLVRRRFRGTRAGTTSTWIPRTGRWSTNCCAS